MWLWGLLEIPRNGKLGSYKHSILLTILFSFFGLKIHWPASMKKGSVGFKPENLTRPDIPSTWRAMEALFDSGKARAIGVSNFSAKKLEDLLAVARVPPAVNQVEIHPVWQQPKLHEYCKSKGIHLTVSIQNRGGLFRHNLAPGRFCCGE